VKKYSSLLRPFTGANALLAILICIIFLVPLVDQAKQVVAYKISFTILLIISAISLQTKRKLPVILIAGGIIVLEWLGAAFDRPLIYEISQTSRGIYFIIIVIGLIRQTALAKRVTEQVIVDAISGYLLLGIVFTIGTIMIAHWNGGAYTFSSNTKLATLTNMNDFIYYTFTTFTTTGYGDLLPLLPIAKSFSIFTAASGQLYIATIISLLVGKYAGTAKEEG